MVERRRIVVPGEFLGEGKGYEGTFVEDGKVVYVGETERELKSRLNLYRWADESQKTNVRIREEIMKSLKNGKKIEIFSLPSEDIPKVGVIVLRKGDEEVKVKLDRKVLERVLISYFNDYFNNPPEWNKE